ncbi:MAG: winged helix-turn-helix transcriptional regulator [Dehalococcoidia bacterium]|nr:MAG: winged helix-turn-helix transcriptional regulator [Dehalococcoidia bacterium]
MAIEIGNNTWLFEIQAEICKTLSQPKRLMLVHQLRTNEKSVGQLSSTLNISQPNVSQHLSILRKRGILTTRREGSTVYYRLSSPKIGEACDLVYKFLTEQLENSKELACSLSSYNKEST